MFLRLIKFTIIILMFAFCISADTKSAPGQSKSNEPHVIESNDNGEETQHLINLLMLEAFDGKERVFVIARLGTGEKSRQLNLARLNKAKRQSMKFAPPQVFAEGEPVKGKGRVEFYVGSRLWLIVLAERNKLPFFTLEM